ncbi:MAG: nucleotidyltransferase domain-containing protein [Candidatus Bathyarchaeia archaeon]
MNFSTNLDIRKRVAREAASLIYHGVEKEYKQAKLRAAKNLGVHFLPSNFEVAIELDRIAEESEGSERLQRLIRMRIEALKLMKILEKFNPKLVGSVWRGTIHRESDIDITVKHSHPEEILKILRLKKFNVVESKWDKVTKKGGKKEAFHIILELPIKERAEITVRSPEEESQKERCEIFGDIITGLDVQELESLLAENPLKKFTPL